MIKVLGEKVVNKIAAGEVVERPASVVKELIENAIDANASRIEVEIKNYGKDLIKVSDNGDGMCKEDLELSVVRHATSKIGSEEDLFSIRTLGFRGEALASIAAVSKLVIRSRKHDAVEGYKIEAFGGVIVNKTVAGCPAGTVVEVKDLFFNTPARLKFLKSDTNELKNVTDIVTRYALLYNQIAFKLVHNNHVLFTTNVSDDILNNIAAIYGADTARQCLKVDYEKNGLNVNGYVVKPSLLKADKSWQNVYVNKRFVKNDTISKAVYDAYHTLLFVNKHPVFVLNLTLNPSKVDVNVHPAKDVVKFEQDTVVYDLVFNAVKEVLVENELVTDYKELPKQLEINAVKQNFFPRTRPEIMVKEKQQPLTVADDNVLHKLPNMKLLGQVLKTYFLAETDDGFLIIDQHAAEERINYEKFKNQLLNKSFEKQTLLKPVLLNLSPDEKVFAMDNIEKLDSYGLETEDFGDNTVMLRTLPALLKTVEPGKLFNEILSVLKNNKQEDVQEEVITRMACRSSIKAGDELSVREMENLLQKLDKTELPWTCPHGRPIIIRFNKDSIEKLFRRKA